MQLIDIGDTKVVQVRPDDSVDHAIALLEQHGFRHLPVMERGRILGMVSDRDLLSAVAMLPSSERMSAEEGPARVGATRISQIMSSPAITVEAEASLEVAAELMLREGIRAIPLVYQDRVAGIVTETDFLKCYLDDRPIARKSGWRLRKVADLMSSPVVTLKSGDQFVHAVRTMQSRRIRHLVIVDDGKMMGLVSDRDLRRGLGGLPLQAQDERASASRSHMQVVMADVMSREVMTIEPSASLAEVAEIMVKNKFGSLPVMRDGNLVGIVTEADLLRHFVASCKD
ncbi:MAG: CBS domain-containing protein [Planctomycetes bacterium]|nr:CBS domain-containing protein [Planctomycetota bacterium]